MLTTGMVRRAISHYTMYPVILQSNPLVFHSRPDPRLPCDVWGTPWLTASLDPFKVTPVCGERFHMNEHTLRVTDRHWSVWF